MEAVYDKIFLGNKEQVIHYLDITTKELHETISSFTAAEFNLVPYEGSWTAGQVAEHVLKSESGLVNLLTNNNGPTDRNPDEKNDLIQSAFLDFSTKMKSPEFVVPSHGPHNPEQLLFAIQQHRNKLAELVQTLDLSLTCYNFALPGMGDFTRMEWLCFMVCHSLRHIRQLRNIQALLQKAGV